MSALQDFYLNRTVTPAGMKGNAFCLVFTLLILACFLAKNTTKTYLYVLKAVGTLIWYDIFTFACLFTGTISRKTLFLSIVIEALFSRWKYRKRSWVRQYYSAYVWKVIETLKFWTTCSAIESRCASLCFEKKWYFFKKTFLCMALRSYCMFFFVEEHTNF